MAFARHLTLTGNTVSTVTFTDNSSRMEIINRDAADEVFVSYDGTANPAAPTVGGNDNDVVLKAVGATTVIRRVNSQPITVKLIAATATKVTVRGIP